MKKHVSQYHDEENTASVPEFLPSKLRSSGEDRSMFTFAEVKTKRRVERFSPSKEFEIATNMTDPSLDTHTATSVQTTAGSLPSISAYPQDTTHTSSNEDVDYIIKCICGFQEDDGNTVYCDSCDTWQHTECYYMDKHGNVPTKEELEDIVHLCADCQPRLLNYNGAVERQRVRRELNPAMAPAVFSSQPRQQTQGNTVSPPRNTFSGLLQVANTNHLTARSASPAVNISQQGSPFRESSQFNVEGDYSNPSNPADATRLTSAAQLRQQQKLEADAHVYAQHHPPSRPEYLNPPKTISPKEALLDYDTIEDDAEMPLLPSMRRELQFSSHNSNRGQHRGDSLPGDNDNEVPGTPLGGNFVYHEPDEFLREMRDQYHGQEQERATKDLESDTYEVYDDHSPDQYSTLFPNVSPELPFFYEYDISSPKRS